MDASKASRETIMRAATDDWFSGVPQVGQAGTTVGMRAQ
jgi:hypothetical protein